MKKIILGIMICLVSIILYGCSNKIDELSKYAKLSCDVENVKLASNYGKLIISSDNKVYRVNYKKIFSNDRNCIEIPNDNNFEFNGYLLTDRNNFTTTSNGYIEINDNTKNISSLTESFYPSTSKSDYTQLSLDRNWYLTNKFYIIENNIYDQEDKLLQSDISKDEKIVGVFFGKQWYIKTDKAFYYINKNKINKEQCEKYADIKCEYEYIVREDEFLSKDYKKIIFITNSGIWNNDKRMAEDFIVYEDWNVYVR